MPPLVVTDGVQVYLEWSKGGVIYAMNVLGARRKSPITINQAFADSLSGAIMPTFTSSGLAALVHTTVRLHQIGVRYIGVASQPKFIGSAASVPGTGIGKLLPPQVASCVTLRTALAGKEFRGRTYLPGFAEAANDTSGVMTQAATVACKAFIDAVDGAMDGQNLELAVISRQLSQINPVTLTQVRDTTWETIRSRTTV